jgi:uncharacterized membrane protein YsdA (DUF1294 family)/rhodanese-related sulfurtransferase
MNPTVLLYIAAAAWNLAVFGLFALDKLRAINRQQRISERSLLLAAVFMGAPGALAGMVVFHHKKKKAGFMIGVPLSLVMNIVVVLLVFSSLGGEAAGRYQSITPGEAMEKMSGDVIILDVRTVGEFNQAHIEGAILIPDYELAGKAPELLANKRATILVYCKAGVRSERAARALIELGYTRVYDFGGIDDWPFETVGGGE